MLTDKQIKKYKALVNKLQREITKDKEERKNINLSNNIKYIGRCYRKDTQYIKVIEVDRLNEYRMICLVFDLVKTRRGTFGDWYSIYKADIGLFCYSNHPSGMVIGEYEEITQDEYNSKMDVLYKEIRN